MLDLGNAAPAGVKFGPGAPVVAWRMGDQIKDCGFGRFYPLDLRAVEGFQKLAVVWGDFGDLPFSDPYFTLTLKKARGFRNFAKEFMTDYDALQAVAEHSESMPFAGAVFHMARTGSTLISRLLNKSGIVSSISEYTIIDQALRRTEDWFEEDRNRVLNDVVRVMARPRRPSDQRLVLKMTDATPNTKLPLFRSAFPDTPWIFVYRDPVEIMVSMLTKRTGTLDLWLKNRVNGARFLNMPELADAGLWPADFVARTLRRYCIEALKAARATPSGLFLAVSYDRLPNAIWETIAPHFGVQLSDEQVAKMQLEARFSAKEQTQVEFKADRESKMKRAPPRLLALARKFVEPVLDEIRALPQG